MSSHLTGLIRKLIWKDFGHPRPGPPQPFAANTGTRTGFSGVVFGQIQGTRPSQFQLKDSVVATVAFNPATSWVKAWVFAQTQQIQDALLQHEQGHYNLVALSIRDFFIDVMQ